MTNWEERWETQPEPNRPMTVKLCVDHFLPKAGQEITLVITADDPDATIVSENPCQVQVSWGDEDPGTNSCNNDIVPVEGRPQPTPAPEHGHVVVTMKHVYKETGIQTISTVVHSGPDDGKAYHPYKDVVKQDFSVNVHA